MISTSKPELSVFQFVKSNCLIVGTFNNHIIQPRWLSLIGLFPSDQPPLRFESNLSQPGIRFSLEGDPVLWTVQPDKLLIESRSTDTNCGSLAAKVLEELPWTPLVALGTNTEFEADLTTESLAIAEHHGLRLNQVEIAGYHQRQTTKHFALSSATKVFNFQLSLTEDQLKLLINIHTELSGKKNHSEKAKIAVDSCRSFVEDRTEAIKLANQIFECGVKL